jgi:hypothetical protein
MRSLHLSSSKRRSRGCAFWVGQAFDVTRPPGCDRLLRDTLEAVAYRSLTKGVYAYLPTDADHRITRLRRTLGRRGAFPPVLEIGHVLSGT